MQSPSYFIFDLDGTLALSEHVKMLATQIVCKELGYKPITELEYFSWAGIPTKEVMSNLLRARHINPTKEKVQELTEKRRVAYDKHMHKVERHEPIVGLLKALSPHYKTALATTTNRRQGTVLIKQLGIADLFDVTVFGDDVKKNKPDPECYITAAKMLGAKPKQCIIFEDSDAGIAAAETFGAQVVKVSI
jgi:beta-phosphoglucomutase